MGGAYKYLLLIGVSAALIVWTIVGMSNFKEKNLQKHMQIVEANSELWYNNRYKGYVKICSSDKRDKSVTCSISEKKFFVKKKKKNYRIIGEVEDYDKPIEYIAKYKCSYDGCFVLDIE